MEVVSSDKFPERNAQAFMAFLDYCQKVAVARGQPQIASVSLRVRHIDPLAVLQSIYEVEQLHGYIERPQSDEAIAGAEAVLSKTASGANRFQELRAFADEVLANTIAIGDMDAPLAGPYFFCSFTFENDTRPDAAFEAAQLFVPLWQVARRGNECIAVANVLVSPESDVQLLAKRIIAAHGKFSVFDYSDIPDHGEALEIVHSTEVNPGQYQRSVSEALSRIAEGRYEKIVLSRSLAMQANHPFEPLETVNRLRERFSSCYCFSFANGQGTSFIGASPERLVQSNNGSVQTEALAGSAARGESAREDAQLASQLLQSDKDLREHAHVVESICQRLRGLGLEPQLAERPALLKLANVQHLRTPITASKPDDLHLLDIAAALHPTPAVGGRPRGQAVPDIAELEGAPRGLFSGLVGGFSARGEGQLVVGLRSGFFSGSEAQLYAGAGIVEGSDPGREKVETDMKLRALLDAIV